MDLLSTLSGSLLEGFFPRGWDLARFDRLAALPPAEAVARRPHWHERFEAVACADLAEFEVRMGHEIALEIRAARDAKRDLILILPVGPMGMYRWIVFFLREWGVGCGHVHGFNMDEWADAEENTLPGDRPGSFQRAMEAAFYGPLGAGTVPPAQRSFATRALLPSYAERIEALRRRGARPPASSRRSSRAMRRSTPRSRTTAPSRRRPAASRTSTTAMPSRGATPSGRGSEIGVPAAEAFIQHLGHAYPKDEILRTLLPGDVRGAPA
ncbi:MAG: hypothetical protein JXP34_18185 [Planctomycetes bacterium]|nr:hypothetical protein [Planctomycetota bacterium]